MVPVCVCVGGGYCLHLGLPLLQVLVLRLDCLWSQERQISQGVERFWEVCVGGKRRDRRREAVAKS